MNDYTQDVHVGGDEDEKEKLGLAQEGRTPTTRLLGLIHKIDELDQLKAELRLAMAEAAKEGEEKPVYVGVSNFRQGRFGCDWYMYDLVKKQRVKVFVRTEWEGGVRHHDPAVAVSGSVIYVLGGACACPNPAASDSDTDTDTDTDAKYCKDVLYLDTKHPQDGWKVGPQLPSTHQHPFAISIHQKLYLFGALDTVPSVLDTAVKGGGWECLPQLHLPPSKHSTAHPDPSRDRILLLTPGDGLFAYSLLERKWEHIDPNFDTYFTTASVVVGDVLYYYPGDPEDDDENFEIMRAYDLVHCQQLTVVYHNLTEYNPGFVTDWDHLLDLGCAKLCLFKLWQFTDTKKAFFLKLKVEKDTRENKVHITSMSAKFFNTEVDDRCEGALTM